MANTIKIINMQLRIFVVGNNLDKPMKNIILSLLFLTPLSTFCQENQFDLEPVEKDYYNWITFLSESPIEWFDNPNDNIYGCAYRFVITTSEIYDNIYIENVTFGEEGGNKMLVSKQRIPLNEIADKYDIRGEISGIKFVRWIDSASFIIDIHRIEYSISILKDKVIVVKI